MRVLLFGGSFDPPHRGHAALLTAAAERVRPDLILIVPAFRAPLKAGHSAPAEERLRLVRRGLIPSLPARWRRKTRVETGELLSRRRVYTVETLARLKAAHPGWELHFAAGSDAAAAWTRWRSPRRLKRLCRWWTALRPGAPTRKIPAHFTVIRRPMPDVSSTDLRADLAAGLDCSARLHPRVLARISSRGLYGTGLTAALADGLKPGRFAHTLAVRRLAEALARRWGEDPRQASLAALLHDCGRLMGRKRQARYARKRRLKVPFLAEARRRAPGLLHAYVGEDLARRRFGCRDKAVLAAVRSHTLGAPRMSRLETILYVADAVSEDRGHAEAGPLRRLAFRDLEAAFTACLSAKLRYSIEEGSWLHPLSVALWNQRCARP